VPTWLTNLAALGWRVLVIIALVVVLWLVATAIWTATASIAVAIVVAAVFAPFVLRLRDRGRSRNAAAGIVWAAAILSIGGLLLVLVLAFLPYAVDLVTQLNSGVDEFQAQVAALNLPAWVSVAVGDVVDQVRSSGNEIAGSVVGRVAEAGTILILATFLLFFFLRDGDKAWLWIFQSLGPSKMEQITSAGDDALARVGGFLRGTTVLGLVMALTTYVFLILLNVPLALPLAILTFAATFVPYFGSLVATAFVVLVTLGSEGASTALVMIVLVGIRGVAVSYFVRPQIYGRSVKMHPALVLIVLPAGFQLGGVIGLFAAVPVTAVITTVAQAAISIVEPAIPPQLPDLVPAWLDRIAQWSWRLLVAIGLVAVMIVILTSVPLVLLPVILALIFAATLEPIVGALVGRGRTRGLATAVTVVTTTVAIVGVLVLTMVSLVEQAAEIGTTATDGAKQINEAASGSLQLGVDAFEQGSGAVVSNIVAVSESLAAVGTITILSILLTYYFLKDGAGMWQRVMRHTRGDDAGVIDRAGRRAFEILGGYMFGTAAISLVGAASQYVIMVVLGLPLALPVFVLSFFGGFIPYIGSLLTTLLAFFITVAVGDPVDILIMLIWTVVFNLVQGNIVAPVVYSRTTNIHPAIVLVSIPAASAVAGILGMFVVVPAIGVVAATWRTFLWVMATPTDRGDLPGSDPAGSDPPDDGSEPPPTKAVPGAT
jgi:predicted PurR-regulated permease PerM